MKCAVLGATGFLGINLCQALVRQGHVVHAFGRNQLFSNALQGCVWMPGDFSNFTGLENAISGCEVVFHLITATTPASANVDKIADLNTNVIGTLNLLNACRELGVRRVVFVSSGGTIYGIPEKIPTPESAITNPITAYGIGKLAIEKYLGLYEHLYGLEHRILRVANPFGPYQIPSKNQGVIGSFLYKAIIGRPIEIWGDGSVIRDYIYIDDVVNSLILAATHEGDGRVFNIGSGEGRSLNSIILTIENLLGKSIQLERHSGRLIDVPVSILDNNFAAKQLNWHAITSFNDGLNSTISWIRSNY